MIACVAVAYFIEDAKPLNRLLTSLKLPWLRLLVTQTLLDDYDHSLLVLPEPDNEQLSLKLIVSTSQSTSLVFVYIQGICMMD